MSIMSKNVTFFTGIKISLSHRMTYLNLGGRSGRSRRKSCHHMTVLVVGTYHLISSHYKRNVRYMTQIKLLGAKLYLDNIRCKSLLVGLIYKLDLPYIYKLNS